MTNPPDDWDEVDEYPSLAEELAEDEAQEAKFLDDDDDDDELNDGYEVFFNDDED